MEPDIFWIKKDKLNAVKQFYTENGWSLEQVKISGDYELKCSNLESTTKLENDYDCNSAESVPPPFYIPPTLGADKCAYCFASHV